VPASDEANAAEKTALEGFMGGKKLSMWPETCHEPRTEVTAARFKLPVVSAARRAPAQALEAMRRVWHGSCVEPMLAAAAAQNCLEKERPWTTEKGKP
jgi:hypothetical protein